jgi:hypothetical protein
VPEPARRGGVYPRLSQDAGGDLTPPGRPAKGAMNRSSFELRITGGDKPLPASLPEHHGRGQALPYRAAARGALGPIAVQLARGVPSREACLPVDPRRVRG